MQKHKLDLFRNDSQGKYVQFKTAKSNCCMLHQESQ